ncbi:MAG TPA: hypothetical protein VKY26_01585 [Actinomycetota bacterium]|nr:hypothetical protein [Actinomycetota bacterium]
MAPSAAEKGERVVLGRRTPDGMVNFQWTGNEPEGLNDVHLCELLGASWEGHELVTYNYPLVAHNYLRWGDEFLEDSD